MKKAIFPVMIFVIVLASTTSVFAIFTPYNYSIQPIYAFGQNISGYVNISFQNEPINNFFTDNFGNSVSLKTVLNASNYKYNCSSPNCEDVYISDSPLTTKTLVLTPQSPAYVGLVFKGVLNSIDSVSFNVTSNATISSTNQLKLDLFNDGTYDIGNTHASTQSGQANFGCYSSSNPNQVFFLDTTTHNSYCQEIQLKEAPKYDLGAWISAKSKSGNDVLQMSLYDANGNPLSSCTLPNSQIISAGSDVYCSVNTSVLQTQNYYVCINQKAGTGSYNILGYSSSNSSKNCGFYGNPISQKTNSYSISARPKTFAPFGTIHINNTLSGGYSFPQDVENYIISKYGDLGNCSAGCLVPIKLNATVPETVTFSNILLKYTTIGGQTQSHYISSVSKTSSKINSKTQILPISNFFSVPKKKDNLQYVLSLGRATLINTGISIVNFTSYLSPINTASNYPTDFVLSTNLNIPIKNYVWHFGDNSTSVTTSTNKTSHTYNKIGTYWVKVTFLDSNKNKYFEEYQINVSSPSNLINNSISTLNGNLIKFKSGLSKLSSFEQKLVESKYNSTQMSSALDVLKKEQANITSEKEYPLLISQINSLTIPYNVYSKVVQKNSPFFSNSALFNLDPVLTATKETTNYTSDELSSAIDFWDQSNFSIFVSQTDIGVSKNTGTELIQIYNLTVKPKKDVGEYYIFYPEGSSVTVYNEKPLTYSGYKVIKATGKKNLVFTSTNSFSSLPFFLTPKLSQVSVSTTPHIVTPKRINKPLLYAIGFIVLLIIAIIVYAILQSWYKKKYENYLFKDRNNLYNVMVFVNSEKKSGKSNEEIKQDLKKSGWSAEQIRYIMRKYEGKQTGMFSFSRKEYPLPPKSERVNPRY